MAIAIFPLLMIFAGAGDVMTSRIPNRLLGATALCFIPLSLLTGMPAGVFALHLLAASALLAFGYCLFLFGFIGGGDAKMMAVAGLWLGYPCSIVFLSASAVAGGVLAAAIGAWYLASLEGGLRSRRLAAHMTALRPSVPYGFALAAGAILATPHSWWMRIATS